MAVKYGIKKFEFHLLGYHFLIHMDNSSLPKVLDFKNNAIPDKQVLRLKDWFAKYDFSLKHLKGKENIIDVLHSRPQPMKLIPFDSNGQSSSSP